jgi:endo-1,4-beta-mannosidase
MDLENALTQFDRTAANVELLEELLERYHASIPAGINFGLDTAEIDQLYRDYEEIGPAKRLVGR